MKLTSIIAIYFLFFAASAFILLPFGSTRIKRTAADAFAPEVIDVYGELIQSAPHKFDVKRHFLKAALLAAVLFAIYYANWTFGWITPDDLDFYD